MGTKKCQEFLEIYTFDEAITQIGYGRFHYKVFSICALCIMCVGFQNGLTSYVFSAAGCDLNFRSQDLGLLNVSFMLGGTISAFLWGIIADVKGRKNVLIWTIIADAMVTVICSLMQDFTGLMICRFFNGVLIGCGGSVTYTYLAEFHAPTLRAKSVCYSGIAFIAAWVLLPVLAFLILPLNFNVEIFNVPYTPWRAFLIIIAAPELAAGLCLLSLPESPKFLHDKNYSERALEILRNIYSQNTPKENQEFSVKKLSNAATSKKDVNLQGCEAKGVRLLRDMKTQIKILFSAGIRIKTLLVCLIMFSNMFGYFGLGLWLPEFFIRFESHTQLYPNESITLKELTFEETSNSTSNCPVIFDVNTFRNTLIVAISALVVNTLGGWLIGKISVRNLALLTLLFGGFSSLGAYWVSSSFDILVVSSIFQSAMATGNMVIGSIIVEQFPSLVGAMAMCMAIAIGRVGAIASNVAFNVMLGEHTGEVIIIVSVVLLLGALLCLGIPSQSYSEHYNKTDTHTKPAIEISVIHIGEERNKSVQNV